MANSVQHSLTGSLGLPLDLNQREILLRLEIQRLHREVSAVRTLNQEYEMLISSLYAALKNVHHSVCLACKANVEKLVPSSFAVTPVAVNAINPQVLGRFSGFLTPSQSDRSSQVPFWRRMFKGRRRGPLQSTMSGSTNSQVPHHEQFESSQGTSSVTLQPKQIISVTPTHNSSAPRIVSIPRDAERQTQIDWSVTINGNVKPSLKVSFERAITFEGSVACVKFSSRGDYLAAGVYSKRGGGWRAYIYHVKTGTKESVLVDLSARNQSYLWCMCFSSNDQYLAIVDSDKHIRIWEIRKKHVRNCLRGHTKLVTFADFSPDGRFLASTSYDKTLRIWSIRDGFSKVLEDNAHSFSQVRFSPNGKYVAAANDDGMLRIWNARTSRLVMKWLAHESLVRGVMFTPDGRGLVSGGWDTKVKYWDISLLEQASLGFFEMQSDKNKEILKLMGQVYSVQCIDISSNGQWVVSGSFDGAIHIWDAESPLLQCTLQGHRKHILSVDFSPTGEYLASGSADAQLALWRYVAT